MATILINLSKYILMFIILFYTYVCFRINSKKNIDSIKGLVAAQKIFTAVIFAICSALILYYAFDLVTLILIMLEFLYIMIFPALYSVIYPDTSSVITNNMNFMLSIGFIMIIRLSPSNALKQFIIVICASVIFFIIPLLVRRKRLLIRSGFFCAIAGIVLLLITYILGKTSFGANLSFTVAGFTFQPSEFVKIIYVLFIASILYSIKGNRGIIISSVLAAMHIIILVLSTDLGAALIFFIVYVVMIYTATGKFYFFAGGISAGCAASFAAYKLFAHVRVRVSAWINPWSDINNKGYQITQSLFAIGTGGFFGMGLYQGLPSSIPVVNKDFVFAAISEEFGAVSALCIIFICLSIFLEIMKIASSCRDGFYRLIAAGYGLLYIFQCFLTIGGVIKFIPSTGVTLPFVSYGGSSVLSSIIMFSIVQSVNMENTGKAGNDGR